MQADEEPGNYISRAKAKLAMWAAMRDEQDKVCRFDRCTATELIQVAETCRNLDGKKLLAGDLYGLHGAWQAMFGEPLGNRSGAASVTDRVTAPALDEHPLLSVPDATMLRPRDVKRLLGLAPTTLKRWRRSGRFPQPIPTTPHTKHIGWPARQLKAWLRATSS